MTDWFSTPTGLADVRPLTVRQGITVDGAYLVLPNGRRLCAGQFDLPQLADLPRPPVGLTRLTLREVVADVQSLHADPANAGASFQVASQFNMLEMIGPSVTPEKGIARYADDHTQGPACAIACAAGTIWRNYLLPLDGKPGQTARRQLDGLADLGAALGNCTGALRPMRNGDALPGADGLAAASNSIAAHDRTELMALFWGGGSIRNRGQPWQCRAQCEPDLCQCHADRLCARPPARLGTAGSVGAGCCSKVRHPSAVPDAVGWWGLWQSVRMDYRRHRCRINPLGRRPAGCGAR